MNQLTLLVIVVVAFCYFGGSYCPSVLKQNKKMLLGLAGGLVLCSFFGLRLEGYGELAEVHEHFHYLSDEKGDSSRQLRGGVMGVTPDTVYLDEFRPA